MTIKVEKLGETREKEQVDLYTLTNENGVSASFTNLGAIWVSMFVPDRNGEMADVLLGYDTLENWMLNPPHCGAVIGRNANRIAGASFMLNGTRYMLGKNNGPNNLHSGPDLYRTRVWEVELEESSLGSRVSFSLMSPDGDQGFPGNASITVTYTLTPDDGVSVTYHMVSDADTVANFTNHAYFNLRGHDSGSVLDHQVWIDADGFTPTDEELIPTGEVVPVKGTPMDFTVMKPIGRDIHADDPRLKIAGGYDHNWALNHQPGELALSARAYDPVSGRVMEVYTDLPGMQFYTANSISREPAGKNGTVYQAWNGYCFETQYFPDAINKPGFASPILKAGETYSTTTVYRFLHE